MKYRSHILTLIGLALSITILFAVSEAGAQGSTVISVDPGDNPLIVDGWLNNGDRLSKSLRLTSSSDVDEFIFLPSDFKGKDSGEMIPREQVTLTGDPILRSGVPKDFQVNVKGIDAPGVYKGTLTFMVPGQVRSQALQIDMEINARLRPELVLLPGSERLELQLVNCHPGLDCSLAYWLLPQGFFIDQRLLQLDNQAKVDASLISSHVVVQGQISNYQITSSEISILQKPHLMTSGNMDEIPVEIKRLNLPPDHYTGTIYLTVQDGTDHIQVPVSLDVRTGPLKPLLFVVFGIVLGRLVKYMQERGEPQSKALQSLNREELLLEDADSEDKEHLLGMLKQVRANVYAEKVTDVENQLQAVQSRHESLKQLRYMESSLASKQQHPEVKKALEKIKQARQFSYNRQDTEAMQIAEEVKQSLGKLVTTMGGPTQQPELKEASERAAEIAVLMENAARMSSGTPQPSMNLSLKERFMNWLRSRQNWWEKARAEGTLYIVRPLLYFILLVGLVVVGMSNLYFNNGKMFGANPISDYLGLVLWGLSADVTSRTLGELPNPSDR
jgi:hypothetical protein